MLAGSCGWCELGEIVGGADQRPFCCHFLDAPQQELSEPPCLLDLSGRRFRDLLSQSVPASPSCALEFVPHGLCQRPGDISLDVAGMLGASGRDVSADLALGQGGKVRLAAVPGIGGCLLGLAAELSSVLSSSGTNWFDAHARSQAMGDDNLGLGIDRGLGVIALDITILGLQDAAFRIGEVALRLAVGLLFGGAGILPLFLRPCDLRSSCAARRRISSAAAALGSASSSALAAQILLSRFCLSATQSGISSPRLLP